MKNKILILAGVLVFSAVFATAALAEFSLKDWQLKKEIKLPVLSEKSFVQLKLDKEVAATGHQFGDVRVVADDSEEVPYQLVVENESVENNYYDSTMLDRARSSVGSEMFILDLGKEGILHSRLDIEASSPNFKRRVSVYASENLLPHGNNGWRLLTDSGHIFKFTDRMAGFSTGSGIVDYPKSTARYLRVVIDTKDVGDYTENLGIPVNVVQARVYRYEVSAAKEESVKTPVAVSENVKDKTTELVIDMGAEGVPTRRIDLQVEDENNFNRTVTIQSSRDLLNWRALGNGYLFKISASRFTGENMSVQYPENPNRYIRIIVFNNDNKPLKFKKEATVAGVIRKVVFEADPSLKYSLYYGKDLAIAPRYDLERFFHYLEAGKFPQAELGAEKLNILYEAPPVKQLPFTERNRGLMNAILVIFAVFVGFMIFLHAKKNFKRG